LYTKPEASQRAEEHKEIRDPFAIGVKAAYLSSIIVIMSLEVK